VKSFFMMDENFLLHKRRAMELLEFMKAGHKAWSLYVFSSANAISQYTMRELVELGVSWIWMGLESPHSAYDKLKGADTASSPRTAQHGIKLLGSTIVGLEHHTPENIEAEIEHAMAHDTDFHQFMLYTPVPGTPLFAEMTRAGAHAAGVDLADIHGQDRSISSTRPFARGFQALAGFRLPPRFRAQRPQHLPHLPHHAGRLAALQERPDPRPRALRPRLERYFEFQALGADWKTEVLAGFTTFMTMAYIVFVNPAILHETGMPLAAVTAATCISAAAGSFLMGGFARYPIALAPGMGLNAYFTYAVVKGMGVPWQAALGAVFISGVAFLLLTLLGVRQLILSAIPHELYAAVAAGVGLFIAFIGFRNSGIIVPNPPPPSRSATCTDKSTALALFGLLLIAALLAWRVRAAMLIGILATTAAGLLTGVAKWAPQTYSLRDLAATAGKLDIAAACASASWRSSSSSSSSTCSTTSARWWRWARRPTSSTRWARSRASTASCFPTPSPPSWARAPALPPWSATSKARPAWRPAGAPASPPSSPDALRGGAVHRAGGGRHPAAATAPALIVVGSMMVSVVAEIAWHDPEVAIPAFLTMMTIPLTFSIANGLAFGFTAYTLLKMLRGKFREVNWFVYLLTALFILRFRPGHADCTQPVWTAQDVLPGRARAHRAFQSAARRHRAELPARQPHACFPDGSGNRRPAPRVQGRLRRRGVSGVLSNAERHRRVQRTDQVHLERGRRGDPRRGRRGSSRIEPVHQAAVERGRSRERGV
jgi:AGZA family xanthine/uracil permease-like MFS transporter